MKEQRCLRAGIENKCHSGVIIMIKPAEFRRKSITHNEMTIHPIKINGIWDIGYSLDVHSLHSELIGVDEFGHNMFDTVLSEIGEAVYQLKYKKDISLIEILGDISANAIKELILVENTLDCIIPVPPSDTYRKKQPVFQIVKKISVLLKLPYEENLIEKTTHTDQMKNVAVEERSIKLKDVFTVSKQDFSYNNILLFDDLFQSGATANECVKALKSQKDNVKVFLVTMTKTRRS